MLKFIANQPIDDVAQFYDSILHYYIFQMEQNLIKPCGLAWGYFQGIFKYFVMPYFLPRPEGNAGELWYTVFPCNERNQCTLFIQYYISKKNRDKDLKCKEIIWSYVFEK